MSPTRRLRPLQYFLAALLPLLGAGACSRWVRITPEPAEYFRTHAPSRVLIYRLDSSTVMLRSPRVSGDTLVGAPTGASRRDSVPLQVPRDSVLSMFEKRFSAGRTLKLLGGVVGGVLAVGAISCASSDDNYC